MVGLYGRLCALLGVVSAVCGGEDLSVPEITRAQEGQISVPRGLRPVQEDVEYGLALRCDRIVMQPLGLFGPFIGDVGTNGTGFLSLL